MIRRTFLIAAMAAAWSLSLVGGAAAQQIGQIGSYYRNPYTGSFSYGRFAYNPYTGRNYWAPNTYNPYTGSSPAATSGPVYYNSYTNVYRRAPAVYNPYTGRYELRPAPR